MADDDATTGRPAKRAAGAAARATKGASAARKATASKAIPLPPKKSTGSKAASKKATASRAGTRKAPADAADTKAAPRGAVTVRTGASPAAEVDAKPAKPSSRRIGSRLAAEQTFDDDWAPPEPSTDPGARARALLRTAAADIQARESTQGRRTGYEPATEEAPPEVVIAPTRRFLAPTRSTPPPDPEPEPEAEAGVVEAEPEGEWVIGDDIIDEEGPRVVEEEDEEPIVDRIPDAMDVLSVGGASPPPAPRRVSRRTLAFPPPAAPPPPPPPPPAPVEPTASAPVDTPPPWTPPAQQVAAERSGGGAGLSVLAIVLSLLVPIVGAILGFVLAKRAGDRGLRLSGVARVVSVVALVLWLAAAAAALVAARDRGIDYSKLKVGDCFDSSATNEVRGIDVKPCTDPHNSEVFFLVTHPAAPGEAYPGKDALVQFAADACLGQPLTDYLGIPLGQSRYKDFEIVPQESAWNDGRRVLVCGIDTGGEGRISESVKGTAR